MIFPIPPLILVKYKENKVCYAFDSIKILQMIRKEIQTIRPKNLDENCNDFLTLRMVP